MAKTFVRETHHQAPGKPFHIWPEMKTKNFDNTSCRFCSSSVLIFCWPVAVYGGGSSEGVIIAGCVAGLGAGAAGCPT